MSITTTGIMKQQLMREPLDTTPEAGMEGAVNRPSIVSDLTTAMSGQSASLSTPLINQMMKEERTPIEETDMGQAMGQRMEGVPLTPVIEPNQMPNLEGKYSAMPVLPGNPNPPTKSLYEQNMGLMKPINI